MTEHKKKQSGKKSGESQGKSIPVHRRETESHVPLRDAISRLFDESILPFGEFPSVFESSARMLYPKVDVSEVKDKIKITANTPGMDPDDIDIEVDEEYVTLSGEVEKESEEGSPAPASSSSRASSGHGTDSADTEGETFYRYEREYGSFHRTIPLPARVKPDNAKAKTKNGVLTIEIPKQKEEKTKRVKVTPE